MAQGQNLDTQWRGLREVVSPICESTRSQIEALADVGLTGLVGVQFSITVGVGRGNVPVAARFACDSVSSPMSLSQCYELLSREVFDLIVDENMKAIDWGKKIVKGASEDEETFDSAQHDEARYGVEEELAKISEEIERLSPGAGKAASASSVSGGSKVKRGGKAASEIFKAVSEIDDDLAKLLSDEGLDKIAVGCGRAGILSVHTFRDHTLEELEESLKRSVSLGAKWRASARDKRILAKFGIVPAFMAPPAAAELDVFDEAESVVGDVDFSTAFASPGEKPKSATGSAKLLSGCLMAGRLLGKVELAFETRETIAQVRLCTTFSTCWQRLRSLRRCRRWRRIVRVPSTPSTSC